MSAASLPAHLRKAGPPHEGEADAAARLPLAELLLLSDDARECAQAAVDWLAEKAGARRAICAILSVEVDAAAFAARGRVPAPQGAGHPPAHSRIQHVVGRASIRGDIVGV